MQETRIGGFNERMDQLLEPYSPNIVEAYKRWVSLNGYLPLGTNWLDYHSNVIDVIQDAAVALCTKEDKSVIWIPNWIYEIRRTASNEGNAGDIKKIIEDWKNYYLLVR